MGNQRTWLLTAIVWALVACVAADPFAEAWGFWRHSQFAYLGANSSLLPGYCEYHYMWICEASSIHHCGECWTGCGAGCGGCGWEGEEGYPPLSCWDGTWCGNTRSFYATCTVLALGDSILCWGMQIGKFCALVPCACLGMTWTPPPCRRMAPRADKPCDTLVLRPSDTPPTSDPVHKFGDRLCYQFYTTKTHNVTAVLKTSTYEGRCMNYPVGPAELDTISDMVPDTLPHGAPGHWDFLEHWFEGDRSCFKLKRTIIPGISDLYIRVLDYAAEGDLTAWDDSGHVIPDPQQIPPNYQRFKSTTDADSDGFTAWEEYRGFIISGVHHRLDSTRAQVFVHGLPSDYVGDMESVTNYSIVNAADVESKICCESLFKIRFLDFKSHKGATMDTLNPLCEPGITPPLNIDWADQGIIPGKPMGIEVSDSVVTSGDTVKMGWTWVTDASNPYPGGAGIARMVVYRGSVCYVLHTYIESEIMPAEDSAFVFEQKIKRVFFHEMGHAYNLLDAGSSCNRNCVMKYETSADILAFLNRWSEYTWGTGYGLCPGTRRLRP